MTQEDRPTVLPLAEEALNVSVRETTTGRVRVSTVTETFEEVVRRELRGVRASVERVLVNRTLAPGEAPPVPRTQGNVTIIPILEEVLIVEKRLLLKEELHVTETATIEQIEVPVELRRQQAVIEHLPGAPNSEANSGDENG